jgi:lantibiotic modifying enzyme
MRHALAHLDDIAPNNVTSYYTGWLGIACAAHTLAQCFNEPEWEIQAREVVSALQAQLITSLGKQELDVIGGCASAIPALLQLHQAWHDESLLNAAMQCGEHLLAVARKSKHGLAWATIGDTPRGYELCGYAHGAAGIALALLKLYVATGATHYKHAAYEGFRYERHWFSPAHHNWPDLRDAQPHTSRSALPYDMVAWCHGAAGIGLSRLRAYELTQDNLFLEEATQAAQATLRWVQSPGVLQRESFCRCHGVAGNASFLLAAGNALKQPMWVDAVLEAGRAGLREYASRRLPWPCGVETTRAEVPG